MVRFQDDLWKINDRRMIEILKASAGSGKTFTLARKYIMLLLQSEDRYAYRHILAVTFTNKATEEMKGRILKELHVLATSPWDSDYHKDFVPQHYKNDMELKKAAETVLCNILHDYGAFAVSTIDRFFQQTLKAFSREIGQFASYQVELDRDSLIEESVDRVLDSMTGGEKDEKKLKWLTDNTISQIEGGEGYKLDFTLKNVALRLKSEEHRALAEKEKLDAEVLYSEEGLERLGEGCDGVCAAYRKSVVDAAASVKKAFADAAIDPFDTSSHFMDKALSKYSGLEESAYVPMITDSFRKNAAEPSKWFPKKNGHLKDMVTPALVDSVMDFLALFDNRYKAYNTACMLKSQIYGFGIANELHREFEALLKEKNVLCLDDSNTILKNIIDGTDTPFIYEKLGVRYENFLLDEFQDTSRVQWDNFRPLLKNSIDSGFYSLIVGDVKQSIYRFRNSDWKLLRDEVPEAFGNNVVQDTLDTNWRSSGNIVRFNNSFFTHVSDVLDRKYGEDTKVISGIYEDVEQKIAKTAQGAVRLTFCPQENELQAVLDSVNNALKQGYSYKDIAVLVRWKKDGAAIASYLISNKVRVVTDDSLLVSSSITVRRLVSLLSSMDNPDDSAARYLAMHLDIELPDSYASIIDLCEELLRKLKDYDAGTFESEVLYVQSFMDVLRDYVTAQGNSLHSFLKEWEGNTRCISSPSSGDAVRIMTVHKSKGLDFPYVIVPFLEGVELSRYQRRWCRPDVKGTALEGVAQGIYDVTLSSKSEDTLFASHYREEMQMQYVDNVNVVYVAFTRAKDHMEIISSLPEDVRDAVGNDTYDGTAAKNFSQILYGYACNAGKNLGFVRDDSLSAGEAECFLYGEMSFHESVPEETDMIPVHAGFCSWPLNPCVSSDDAPVAGRGRLRISADSFDFFADEGVVGVDASRRIKGIVLHDILSHVFMPDDLDDAVAKAVAAGTLSAQQAGQARTLLSERILAVSDRGWFPGKQARVLNEVSLIDSDGEVLRPDRVVISGNKVSIVDYKFGDHYRKYERQLRRYADVWRRMGYEDVTASIWYVLGGEIVDVV